MPPCVDESTCDALSYGNNIVSQFGLGCNRKFVDGKEKTGAAPFKLSGQYRPAGKKTEVTLVAGKRVPPVATGATTFTLVDKTKHSGGGR